MLLGSEEDQEVVCLLFFFSSIWLRSDHNKVGGVPRARRFARLEASLELIQKVIKFCIPTAVTVSAVWEFDRAHGARLLQSSSVAPFSASYVFGSSTKLCRREKTSNPSSQPKSRLPLMMEINYNSWSDKWSGPASPAWPPFHLTMVCQGTGW